MRATSRALRWFTGFCVAVAATGMMTANAHAERRLTTFDPSRQAFRFSNGFTLDLRFDTVFGTVSLAQLDYGLCGGMTFAALDAFRANQAVPTWETTPNSGPYFDYLYRRQIDSLSVDAGFNLMRMAELQQQSNHDLDAISLHEFAAIRERILANSPVPVGLINSGTIWQNHQVLAVGFDTGDDGTKTRLLVYNPNLPGTIQTLIFEPYSGQARWLRGIFVEHYYPQQPPALVGGGTSSSGGSEPHYMN